MTYLKKLSFSIHRWKLFLNFSIELRKNSRFAVTFYFKKFLGISMRLLVVLCILPATFSLFSQDAEEMMYVKNFVVGQAGGISYNQADFIRKEFIEEVQKLNKYKLVGPEAEDAIKLEQAKIEAEGGASMMCRADECRRRLLRVASADLLVEGVVERVGQDLNEIKLDVHGRKIVISSDNSEKKEQSLNVYSVKYKIQKDEKDSIRMLTLASKILAKKISGVKVSKDEEAQVSGLKPLGRDDLDYLARSAVVPGWGQYERENYLKAFIFGGAFLVALAQVNKVYSDYSALDKRYSFSPNAWAVFGVFRSVGTDLSSLGSEPSQQLLTAQFYFDYESSNPYKKSINGLNKSLSIMGGIYFLNLLDAYFSSSKYYFDRSEGLSFDFSIQPNRYTFHTQQSNPPSLLLDNSFLFQVNYRY